MARRPVLRKFGNFPGASLAWIPWVFGKRLKSCGWRSLQGELGTEGMDRKVAGSGSFGTKEIVNIRN
jgi:hypothetical protein